MWKIVSASGLRSASAGAGLPIRVVVSAERSRRTPSPPRALAIAVLTRSPSTDPTTVTTANASDPAARLPRSQVTTVPIEHSPCEGRTAATFDEVGGMYIARVSDSAPGPSFATRTTNVDAASTADPAAGPDTVTDRSDAGARGDIRGRTTKRPSSMPFTTTAPLAKKGYEVHAPLKAAASSAG